MSRPDITGDARRAMDVLKSGGGVIFPVDVGYTFIGGSAPTLQKIFTTKGRAEHKRNAMIADRTLEDEIHILDTRGKEVLECITVDYDLPFGPIAPFRLDHPLIRKLEEYTMRGSTVGDTLAMLVNAGPFHAEMCQLSRAEQQPLFGSSANLTGTGTRFRVADIQPELREIADLVIDYGLRKYHTYRRSGTLMDLRTLEVVRIGACYDLITDIMKRHFNVELPPDPGLDSLPSGHLRERSLSLA